jgi:glycine hydroxymethyltransferase
MLTKVSIIILGSSLILYPHPVKEISAVARELGIVVGYDGSHVLGLIAGHTFQDPLREGAIALFGSTHKTFFGPQGGIILANEDKPFADIVHPSIVDNAHWNRIAALTMALLEIETFGESYAKQVIKNAKALAKSLVERKMPVKGPKDVYTESHQVLLAPKPYQQNKELALKLEEANIIVNNGIRLGVNEVTRRGMKESEMNTIAEFIERIFKGEDPKKVAIDVIRLRTEFSDIEYRFKDIIDLNYFIS